MFAKEIYLARCSVLMRRMSSGVILLLGHDEASINFGANAYPFRQDSSFQAEPSPATWSSGIRHCYESSSDGS